VDVTADYTDVADFTVELLTEKPDSVHFAYVAVFNDGDWRPIDWAKIEGNKANFKNVGTDIMYLPVYYSLEQEVIPANYPFLLDTLGNLTYMIPDTVNLITLKAFSTTKRSIYQTTDKISKANFEAGSVYELFYWKGEWKKVGEKIAKRNKPLVFRGVPSKALYWLIKKDGRKEERIFTLNKDGIQIWW
jgi:hypothetical protein